MADTKITALTALTAADPANDVIPIVDVSDTSMAASGTTKKISVNNILGASGTATLASATITGDLTVDTNVLKVDTTNDRVGIGTVNLFKPLTVQAGSTGAAAINQGLVINSSALYGVGQGVSYSSVVFSRNRSIDVSSLTASAEIFGGNAAETSSNGGFLGFRTQNAAGTLTDRYTIDSTGISTWSVAGTTAMTLNATGLGVGDSPSYKLHVAKTTDGTLGFFRRISGTINPALTVYCNETGNTVGFGTDYAGATSPSITFTTGGSERLRIDGSGNVGIGVTPINRLTVAGNMAVGGTGNNGLQFHSGSPVSGNFVWWLANDQANSNVLNLYYYSAGVFSGRAFVVNQSGNFMVRTPATPPTIPDNEMMVFNLTSNTNLRVSVKGTDGVTRVANITLA